MSNPLFGMMNGMIQNNPMLNIMQIMKSGNPQEMAMGLLKNQNPQMFSQLQSLMNSGATPQQVMQQFGISEQQINQVRQMMGNNVK